MSSDGSTWDQTSGTAQPAGVDWNQYDEELSGQPSLIFVGQSEETEAPTEQIISPIEDLIGVCDMNGRAITEADRQMWASEENSVSFPPAVAHPVAEDEVVAEEEEDEEEEEDHLQQQQQQPAAANFDDGSFVDEGIAGDETDFVVNSSLVVDSALVVDCQQQQQQQPDIVSASAVIAPAENDPDFHWNLHAPEFEFRPSESSPLEHQQQQQTEVEDSSSSVVSSSERKLSATELLIRSSNDSQLAVLLAAANDDPEDDDEMDEPQEELNISPRSDALDDIHNASNAINGTFFLSFPSISFDCPIEKERETREGERKKKSGSKSLPARASKILNLNSFLFIFLFQMSFFRFSRDGSCLLFIYFFSFEDRQKDKLSTS